MDKTVTSKCKKLIVAAIDFGTTFSGYAFSLRHDWAKVLTNVWQGGSLISHKAPTCLLLKKDDPQFVAFGYEAEDKYSDLTAEGEHGDYLYFQRFKMILHKDVEVNRRIMCEDVTGEKLEAVTVFMNCIKYLKTHLFEEIKKSFVGTNEDDIEYVLTVPAIWGDKAKMFMREAAVKAGIKREHLIVALEPEAASIFCQHIPFEKQEDLSQTVLGVVKSGTKYMVVDLGGGTADITVHQKCDDHTLEEILPASGGPWGGKSVDDNFLKFLTDLVGESAMKKFKENHMEDYIEILRTFETKKRTIVPDKEGNTNMTIPQAFTKTCAKQHKVKDFKEVIEKSIHKGNVQYAAGKLKWTNDYFRGFFKKTSDSIIKHIDELFDEEEVRDVKIILMVGGFSECQLVQKAIKDNFREKRVIVPEEAGLAVLKGAVYFGHVPNAISRRSARYTYGIQTWPEFVPGKYDESKRIVINGKARCRDVFFTYVQKGEKVVPGFRKSQIFQALVKGEKNLECAIYISDHKDPKYVDEPGCRRLGILQVPLSIGGPDTSFEIEETLVFGETELELQARDLYTGTQREVIFDLLND